MPLDIEELVAQGRYGAISVIWLSEGQAKWLVAHLKSVLPRKDGRIQTRAALKGTTWEKAAALYEDAELHALAEGDIPTPEEQWQATVARMQTILAPYADDHAPVPDADPPATHVAEIDALLADVAHDLAFYQDSARDEVEQAGITDLFARAMLVGVQIGQLAQLALRAPLLRSFAGEIAPYIDAKRAQAYAEAQRDETIARNALLSAAFETAQAQVVDVSLNRRIGSDSNLIRAAGWHKLADAVAVDHIRAFEAQARERIDKDQPYLHLSKKNVVTAVTDQLHAQYADQPALAHAKLSYDTVRKHLAKACAAYMTLDQLHANLRQAEEDRRAQRARAKNRIRAPKK